MNYLKSDSVTFIINLNIRIEISIQYFLGA